MGNDRRPQLGSEEVVLAVSLKLAASKWKVAVHDGQRERPAVHTVAQPQATARLQAVLALIDAHRGVVAKIDGAGGRSPAILNS